MQKKVITLQNIPLRVIDDDFNLLGEVDRYSSAQIGISWSDIGELELQINRYLQHADKLTKGNIIFPYNRLDQAYIIRYREIELDENGKQTESWRVKALSLKTFTSQRLIYPAPEKAHEEVTGDVETVMRHFVDTQMINPVDPNRVFPNLVLADNQNRGPEIEEKARYDPLNEKLKELSELHGLGWNIELDLHNKQFVFVINEGRNLVANQVGLPQAIFSTEFETIESLEYTESDLEYKNFAIVAGQGEGIYRKIVQIGEAVGKDRYEMFVDARDLTTNAGLVKRGNEKLAEHAQEVYLGGQILTTSRLIYDEDYSVGDMVTVRDKGWCVTMDTRITAAKVICEYGKRKVEVVFDNDKPTFISKMRREIDALKYELKK
ncbi:siphovirus ReqiPepy6 Gp37-like family protein [Lysinibacillus sp. A4]|uniref:siphovirus ReqiPepy6 Gp37-like family protein n=1 Tax=unclassified Lysinibacillus TaxID=2636778 RepID=UPI001EDBAC51|nr:MULTISPECIES: siphovirus ReqiPepy6 Gp37-like family protein [unclassified Lysinibacillus]MCS5500865.1 siphovirus ReqiPepy6 Gp37-like family protein [Lysinibacillus sp. A4]UKJ44280.1 siphovirus ReqiPepy6 Gp37-like family protein [Lysinibacillus sp. ACHW1.5]